MNFDSDKPIVTQIERHYTLNSLSPELNLEKLQLIATSKASPASKIKWLEYFNSSASTREARRLPAKPITEEKLAFFLAKACFWAGVSPLILLAFHLLSLCLLLLTQSCICCVTYAFGIAYAYCLRCQISEQSSIIFEETMRQDRLPINMSLDSEPMLLPAYIEDCRMKLWDHGSTPISEDPIPSKKAMTLWDLMDMN